jgi:hypothetical protein
MLLMVGLMVLFVAVVAAGIYVAFTDARMSADGDDPTVTCIESTLGYGPSQKVHRLNTGGTRHGS